MIYGGIGRSYQGLTGKPPFLGLYNPYPDVPNVWIIWDHLPKFGEKMATFTRVEMAG